MTPGVLAPRQSVQGVLLSRPSCDDAHRVVSRMFRNLNESTVQTGKWRGVCLSWAERRGGREAPVTPSQDLLPGARRVL